MKSWPVWALWVAVALAPASGQQPPAQSKPFRGYGFAYFQAAGGCCRFGDILGFGAGGDALVYRGLGTSIDLGYVFPRRNLGCGIGLLTLNPSYHLVGRSKPRKVMPFVTTGYALAFRAGSVSAYNYGGGVTWWFKPKTGLRLEVRDYRAQGGHLVVVRTGMAFR